jgi:glycosyltransferase involved in cell wall biosynthesis
MPVVYDIQDFWPDSLAASGMFTNKFGLWVVDRLCRLFYKAADKIVVLSPGFKKKLIEKNVPAEKIEVIYNWCDDKEITPAQPNAKLAEELGMAERFNVLFAGNMGYGQALEHVLDAAKILETKYPGIQFVFVGDGVRVDFLKKTASQMKLSNVIFHGRKTSEEIKSIFQISDILLVHLKDIPLYAITIPLKTQAYLAAGKPILMGVRGDAAELVEKAGAGARCESENALDIANQIEKLYLMPPEELEKMGKRGAEYYQNELTFSKGVERFELVFQRVIHGVD